MRLNALAYPIFPQKPRTGYERFVKNVKFGENITWCVNACAIPILLPLPDAWRQKARIAAKAVQTPARLRPPPLRA